MTIHAFCHEQLMTHGPLTLEALTDLAVAAGVTHSGTPHVSVRKSLRGRAVPMPDGRLATPLWLLEGRVLTTHAVGENGFSYNADGASDVALLTPALRTGPVPLASGGELRAPSSWGYGWRAPKGWPGVAPGDGELLGLRIRDGALHVELVREDDALQQRGQALAAALEDAQLDLFLGDPAAVSRRLTEALWASLATDPGLLTEPVPPLSECIPALRLALARQPDPWVLPSDDWRPTLVLPAELEWIALDHARSAQMSLDDWLDDHVERSLLALDGVQPGPRTLAKVVPFPVPRRGRSWP